MILRQSSQVNGKSLLHDPILQRIDFSVGDSDWNRLLPMTHRGMRFPQHYLMPEDLVRCDPSRPVNWWIFLTDYYGLQIGMQLRLAYRF